MYVNELAVQGGEQRSFCPSGTTGDDVQRMQKDPAQSAAREKAAAKLYAFASSFLTCIECPE